MPISTEFRSRIDRLLRASQACLEGRLEERRDRMNGWERRWGRFEDLARGWMREEILPRLSVLGEAFANSVPPLISPDGLRVSLCFSRTEEFPVDARVDVTLTHDSEIERGCLEFEASIIPILMEYERQRRLAVDLDAPDGGSVGRFVEDRIVQFVADYLRVRDPESVYQRELRVTDPVCGMTIRRADAAASLVHDDRTYYFCVPTCRERFEADPSRYVRGAQLVV